MKNLKRLLSYLMTIIMGAILFSGIKVTNTLADEVFKFETDKGYLNYVVDNDEITITDYSGGDTELEIPSEINKKRVIKIGNYAFRDCEQIKSIIIPNTVISIGNYAFNWCIELTNLNIPSSVMNIGIAAFKDCMNLTNIKIQSQITKIESYTFYNCCELKSIEIPNTVNEIGSYAFDNCYTLEEIKIPDIVEYIGKNAFTGCSNLKEIKLPSKLKTIGNGAFSSCKGLLSIEIPESVVKIGDATFSSCSNLKEVKISNTLKEIGDSAFSYCENLLNIEIPNSVEYIGNSAFSNCTRLMKIEIPKLVTRIDNSTFSSCISLESIKMSNSITSIGSYAFYSCYSLKSIEIPNSVKSIENGAFYYCTELENIKIPRLITKIENGTFFNCGKIKNIKIPNGVTSIGSEAFSKCENLENIEIPESVENIDIYAFKGCKNLESIFIPKEVTKIENYVFDGCDKLTINGYEDSYAETYAKENSIPFKEIEVKEIQEPEIITTINNFTADKKSPQISGTAIKLSVGATGKGILQYKFIIKDNKTGNWAKLRDYGTNNTYIWKTKATGNKTLYVDVKDEKGQVIRKSLSYTIKEKVFKAPVIKSFVSDKKSPQISGASIKLSVEATGSSTLQYKFIIKDNKTGNWAKLRDYGKSNTYTWKTKATGDKTLYVDVKNENGQVTRKSLSYTIKEVNYSVNTSEFNKVVYDEMYRLVNEHRNNNGLKSLAVDSVMEECAYGKSKHMSDNNYFSHSYEGKYWWNIYPEKYKNACAIGENIIKSYINPNKLYTKEECKAIANRLFESWKNSSGHNANMLSENFEAIGFGIYVNSSGYLYGTQEFIKRW